MASFNQVTLLGRLGRDVEVRHIGSGTAVAEVGLATERTWYDKSAQQKKSETCWTDVTFWGRTAEVLAEYCGKGSLILVSGYLKQDEWEDKESGKKRSKLKVVCENMTMVASKGDDSNQSRGQSSAGEESQDPYEPAPVPEDETPF